jgi:hypothetical protein
VHHLRLWCLWDNTNLTAASMLSIAGVEHLHLTGMEQITITDSFFAPLAGIKCLCIVDSDIEITDAAFDHIKGVDVLYLSTYSYRPETLGFKQLTRNGFMLLSEIKCIEMSIDTVTFNFLTLFQGRDYRVEILPTDDGERLGFFKATTKKLPYDMFSHLDCRCPV